MQNLMHRLARFCAYLGGLVLTAVVLLTCASIAGRIANSALHSDGVQDLAPGLAKMLLATGIGPISGDYELVEAGMAFAIFLFLPLCQINTAHACVDIFAGRFPVKFKRVFQMFVDLVFACVLVVIAWQLFAGMESKYASGQTSLLLQFPIWWAYALCVCGAAAAAIVACYIAIVRIIEAVTATEILPSALGIDP